MNTTALVILIVILLAVNGYLAWRVSEMERYFRAMINSGHCKEKDETE